MSWFNWGNDDVRCPECGGKGNSDDPANWCRDCLRKCEEWLNKREEDYRNGITHLDDWR